MNELPKFTNPLEYIRDYLPAWFGVHPAYGEIAAMVYNAEIAGFTEFEHENFNSLVDRAALGIPYQVSDLIKRNHALKVLMIIIARHRMQKHGEDYRSIIDDLISQSNFTEEESVLIGPQPDDWWNG